MAALGIAIVVVADVAKITCTDADNLFEGNGSSCSDPREASALAASGGVVVVIAVLRVVVLVAAALWFRNGLPLLPDALPEICPCEPAPMEPPQLPLLPTQYPLPLQRRAPLQEQCPKLD